MPKDKIYNLALQCKKKCYVVRRTYKNFNYYLFEYLIITVQYKSKKNL